jgi:hypothetical protein
VQLESWIWTAEEAGQRLFVPPNVAGWDDEHWLDTARLAGRWATVGTATHYEQVDDDAYTGMEGPQQAVKKAMRFWGDPTISKATRGELIKFARQVEAAATAEWQQTKYRGLRQNALRILIATSPDFQTS